MFRTYDIRGIYGKEVTPDGFFVLGKAFESFASSLVVGMDYRRNNNLLASALLQGYGKDEVFMGIAPTPAIVFNSRKTGASITASHNPPEYNGLKPFKEQHGFSIEEFNDLKKEFGKQKSKSNGVKVSPKNFEADPKPLEDYVHALPEFGKGVFDLSGGAVCSIAKVFQNQRVLFSQPDPMFVRHAPEPTPDALGTLTSESKKANAMGFAFDGDGDRCIAVDSGKIADTGIITAFLASRFLKKGDSTVITLDMQDEVFTFLQDNGFNPHYAPIGDVFVFKKAQEANASFTAEKGGHYSFFNHMPYADGVYAAALLSQTSPGELNDFATQFKSVFLSESVPLAKINMPKLVDLVENSKPAPSRVETIDGVKASFDDYTFLIRPSNTQPLVRLSVEAKNRESGLHGLVIAKQLILECKS